MNRFSFPPFEYCRLTIERRNSYELIWQPFQLYDIYLFANSLDQGQWNRFLEWAIEKKICNICLDGLKQADSIFSTSIPPSVFETLHEKGADEEVTIATASCR